MKSFIELKNIRFYAYHGVAEQERMVGNEFVIDLKAIVDLSKAGLSDSIDDTVSYADMYETIEQEMKIPSKLLEHVAARIIRALKKNFSMIEAVEINLYKRNPPISGDIEYAGVFIAE